MVKSSDSSLAVELLEVQRTLGWMDLVIGSITDAVYVTDERSNLVFANQFFSDTIGIPRVFLLGQALDEVFLPVLKGDPEKEFLSSAEKAMDGSGGDTSTAIYEWQYGDKQKIFKISSRYIAPIKQTVYLAKDITTEYEQSVMKSNFINIASHQLRTPMTAIMTYAHMLHDGYGGDLDEEQKKLARSIVVSSERMASLINDILLISRVQNGDENLKANDGTLIDVFNSLETELQLKLTKKKLRFTSEYPARVKKIPCNKFLIHEILSNLLTNGIQYTPDGGSITMKVLTKKDQVAISVSDSGIGIPQDYLPKIFDQFTRAQNAFDMFNEGTGLGLYVVKIIVEQIDGTIDCRSVVNKGTTFTVAFPV